MDRREDVAVRFHYLDGSDNSVSEPVRQTEGSSGYDLCANLPADVREAGITIEPGSYVLVPTGLVMEIPVGYEATIRPRSGLALKYGVTVLNSPGTIDSDYRGEVGVLLINHGPEVFLVRHGARIAQMCVLKTVGASFVISNTLQSTVRGAKGFGSSGSGV
jgi:dUTP pyrophosphatase